MNAPATIAVSPLPGAGSRRAFTLIELLVVFIIIAILAALSLTGLAGARQRAKIDKTKSTIRKIHEIVVPHYESFVEKRVPGPRFVPRPPTATDILPIYTVWIDTSANPPRAWINDKPGAAWIGPSTDTRKTIAEGRLKTLRLMQLLDLPDQWDDVVGGGPFSWQVGQVGTLMSAAARRYSQFAGGKSFADQWESAECLALIVTRGGFAGDATETFRTDEMGDVNANGAPEFLDAWGQPIQFVRWPVGYTMSATTGRPAVTRTLQTGNAVADHDPLDPMKVAPADYRVIPLIFSGGPQGSGIDPLSTDNNDKAFGVRATGNAIGAGWAPPGGPGLMTINPPVANQPIYPPGAVFDSSRFRDDITNHDLITK